jgi:DNA-binding transcriptional LysR family regulator
MIDMLSSMRKLTHRQIESFRAVMITGSFTLAAEKLHTSQPTTSRVIAELAETVGFTLFRRQGRRVTPTADGRALFEAVEQHYRGLDEIEAAAARIRRFEGASLRIASVTSIALSLLPGAIERFRQQLPRIPITVASGNHDMILGQLVGRQCDVGLAIMPNGRPEVDARPFVKVKVVGVVARNHPLARKKGIAITDLARTPLIMVGRHLPGGRIIEQVISEAGQAEPILEVQSGAIACAMAGQGLGIAVLDALTVVGVRDDRLVARPLVPKTELVYTILTSRARGDGRVIETFSAALIAATERLSRSSANIAPISAREDVSVEESR